MGKKPEKTKKPEKPSDSTSPEPQAEAGPVEPGFPIVGIGASAGGLAAFEAFFSGMPTEADPGMAFVLVQHLAPDHKSILTDLVKRYTRMNVFEIEDGMEVRPSCTYIIPPNCDLGLLNGRLYLTEPSAPRGLRMPIDFFFRSLAQDQHEKAICIVLSGTGSDGALGARTVKGEGGMVMAQIPESTEFDGMPRSAISTGLVDFVLPPGEMPAQLIAYAKRALTGRERVFSPQTLGVGGEAALQKIHVLLRTETGHDFSQYKPSTIGRRVERRMAVNQIERLDDYVRYLKKNPVEVRILFKELLIGVTNFFRDPEAFEALQEKVIPHLSSAIKMRGGIRVWTPGCSTGEEAYSIAILIQEHLENLKQNTSVQVFATDIDSQAIEQARAGVFPVSIASDVSAVRLDRFFSRESTGGKYRIGKNVRDLLVFSEQDVIKDPPFSKLDLISCRNLMIYMEGALQKKILPLFHYALNPDGFLFLGSSETIGDFGEFFTTVDRKWKIYQRKDAASVAPVLSRYSSHPRDEAATTTNVLDIRGHGARSLRELTEKALLEHYAPAGVVVNRRGDILYIQGRTGKYLEPAPGEAGVNILRMAREGLKRDLVIALRKAFASFETVTCPRLRVRSNGGVTTINLTVRPLTEGRDVRLELFLVTFEGLPPEATTKESPGPEDVGTGDVGYSNEHVAKLERELRDKEEYIQAAIEELETSNEELKSMNEELQSANEELQSTNEELETSKEELQSVNEELSTVNAELQNKVEALSRVNNDMNNLLAGTGVGTIFVDHQLRIQRFTPAALQVINLIPSDVGRPVGHIVSNLVGYNRLVEDMEAVLNDLIPRENEVQTKEGVWLLMRIRPYRTLENVIEGVVITFVDITEQKRLQESLRESETMRRLAVVVRDSSDAITVLDFHGRILAWNPGAEKLYGYSETEALSMSFGDLIPEGEREEALKKLESLGKNEKRGELKVERLTREGRIIDVVLTASVLLNEEGRPYAVAATERPV